MTKTCPDCKATVHSTSQPTADGGDWPPPFELMKLQARGPETGNWIDIYPAQLEQMLKQGLDIRVIEPPAALAAAPAEPIAWRWRTLPKFSEDAADQEWELTPTAPSFINPHHHEVEPLYTAVVAATPAVRRPVWLRHEGDYVVVLIETDGKWKEVIREHSDGAFSHIWEDNS